MCFLHQHDHVPILLDTGQLPKHQSQFKFELSRMLREDLEEVVKKAWKGGDKNVSSLEKWQANMKRLIRALRGWNMN